MVLKSQGGKEQHLLTDTQPEPEICSCIQYDTAHLPASHVECHVSGPPCTLRRCLLTPRWVGRPHRRFFFGSSSFLLAWSSSTSAMAATAPVTYRSGCGSMPRLRVPCLGLGLGLGLGSGVGLGLGLGLGQGWG